MFTERKAAQMAAFFLDKAGGKMSPIKLLKLMYLADRESYKECGFPISDDDAAAMEHGPVLRETLNLASGTNESNGYWCNLISEWEGHTEDRHQDCLHSWYDRIPKSELDNHQIGLRRELNSDDRGKLSRGGIELMDSIYAKFGNWSSEELVDYTHTLQEWQKNHENGCVPIRPEHILRAVGKSREEAEVYRIYLKESWKFSAAMASIHEEFDKEEAN